MPGVQSYTELVTGKSHAEAQAVSEDPHNGQEDTRAETLRRLEALAPFVPSLLRRDFLQEKPVFASSKVIGAQKYDMPHLV